MIAKAKRHALKVKPDVLKAMTAGDKVQALVEKYKVSDATIYKWRREQRSPRAKRLEFVADKLCPTRAKPPHRKEPTIDALIYLRHAEADMNKRLAAGKLKHLDSAHLYTLLALRELEG